MPIINGLETIRMLKNKFILSTEKMPVILLHSSLDNMQLEKECSDLGIRFRLSKPVKSNDLFNYLCHVNQEDAISLKNEPSTIPKRKNSYEGIKILIAEDVFLNMVLIKAMITELGFNVEVIEAKNGKEAIEKYQEFSPDLILMDVHMPELNGINATKKIREIELLSGNAVPIIALTAGALKEEREKCFENGMNDFLTKPLVPEKIMEMLETYLAKGSSKIKGNQTVEPNNESHLAFQELANLFDSKSTLRDVLIIALNDLPAQILQLEEACIEKHIGKIKEAAHIIRGSSSSMRFGLMAQIAEKIENESKDVWVEALESYLSELKNEWEIVKKIIQKFIH
jgi:CheY-like chemotaxis protein